MNDSTIFFKHLSLSFWFACRATVVEHPDIWFSDDGGLTKMFCEKPESGWFDLMLIYCLLVNSIVGEMGVGVRGSVGGGGGAKDQITLFNAASRGLGAPCDVACKGTL